MNNEQQRTITEEMEYFALQVGYIVGLQSNDAFDEPTAYLKIKKLWKRLKKRKKQILGKIT